MSIRTEVECLMSLNEECGRTQPVSNRTSEDICGWDDILNSFQTKFRPNISFISPKNSDQPILKADRPLKQRLINTLKGSDKDRRDYNKKYLKRIKLEVINYNKKKLRMNEETKFFPSLRGSIYTPNQNNSPCKLSMVDAILCNNNLQKLNRSFRVTTASPVMMIRRKNNYY